MCRITVVSCCLGNNLTTRLIEPVGLLEHGPPYRFRYLRRAGQVEGFLALLSFGELERTYTSPNLFPLSLNGS